MSRDLYQSVVMSNAACANRAIGDNNVPHHLFLLGCLAAVPFA